jgi:hypothetical protein
MLSLEKMPKRILVFATLAALCTLPAVAEKHSTIVTGPVDRAGFQAVLDAADEGDTIVCLGGIYDFSDQGGVVISKGVTIRAANPNDPPLFVGDTVDGTIDGPPVIETDSRTGNNAFLLPIDGVIDGLRIQGLHFTGFERTLNLGLGIDFDAPGCPLVPGAAHTGLVVVGNNIRQTGRAVQVFGGPLGDFSIKNNTLDVIPDSRAFAVLLLGGTIFSNSNCPGGVEFERLESGEIKNNTMSGSSGVLSFGVVNGQIKANSVNTTFLGIYAGDERARFFPDDGPIAMGSVKGNVVTGAAFGIYVEGPTTMAGEVKGNTVDSTVIDVVLDVGANGYAVKDNTFTGAPAFANVLLESDTYDNLVIVGVGDTVEDFGTDNVVIVE